MKTFAAALACAALTTSAASAQTQVGQWSFTPDRNFCIGGNNAASSDGFLMMVTGDAGNDGGFGISSESMGPLSNGSTPLTVGIEGYGTYDINAQNMPELPGYYLPIGTTETMPKFPDKFRMTVKRGAVVIYDGQLTGFKQAIKFANDCDAKASR